MPGQQESRTTTVELSENILHNLGNDLMADSVIGLHLFRYFFGDEVHDREAATNKFGQRNSNYSGYEHNNDYILHQWNRRFSQLD